MVNLSPAWRSGGVIIQAELHRVGGTGDGSTAGGSTVPIVASLRRSRWDCGILPSRSSDEVTPDIVCGVRQYVKRKQATWGCDSSFSVLLHVTFERLYCPFC